MIQRISPYAQLPLIRMQYSKLLEDIFPKLLEDIDFEKKAEENSIYLSLQRQIDYLNNIYIFKNPEEIKMFLLSNKDIIEILLEAPEHIRRIFGDVPIYLELHHDPEEEWDELFIIIKSKFPPEKAVYLENKLFQEWFIKIVNKVGTRLNFTEEPL